MTKVLLINGPPRSGKDAAGKELVEILAQRGVAAKVYKFAHALKVATHGLFLGLNGILDAEAELELACDPASFEEEKDQKSEIFFGATPREAYIAVSELLCKPMFGKRFFGEVLAKNIAADIADKRTPYVDVAIVTDSGFADEARPLIEKFGRENVGLIRINRWGCTFDNDSRSEIFLPELRDNQVDVDNIGTLAELGFNCARIVEDLFGVLRS